MELAFDTKPIRSICEKENEAKRQFGVDVAEVLKHRLADMRSAKSPKDLIAGKPRPDADGQRMMVDLCDGHRIVFKANHPRNPVTEPDRVDWAKVSRIKITAIERDDDSETDHGSQQRVQS